MAPVLGTRLCPVAQVCPSPINGELEVRVWVLRSPVSYLVSIAVRKSEGQRWLYGEEGPGGMGTHQAPAWAVVSLPSPCSFMTRIPRCKKQKNSPEQPPSGSAARPLSQRGSVPGTASIFLTRVRTFLASDTCSQILCLREWKTGIQIQDVFKPRLPIPFCDLSPFRNPNPVETTHGTRL